MFNQTFSRFGVYLFLGGNCLIWYGTAALNSTLYYSLFLLPLLFIYRPSRWLIFVIAGMLYAHFWAASNLQWQIPEQYAADNHLVTGMIEGLPVHQGEVVRIRFKLMTINEQPLKQLSSVYLRLACYRNCPNYQSGQFWKLMVRLKPINGYLNPRGFDYEKWLFSEKYKATGYIVPSKNNAIYKINNNINTIRGKLKAYYIRSFTQNSSKSAALALALGDKSLFTQAQQKLLADNGLAHLMAISGLHVGLAAFPGFILAGLMWMRIGILQRFCKQDVQYFGSFIPAIIYTALAGFGLPAMRALIMLLVFVVVQFSRLSMSVHSRFCLALWIILLSQPLAPLQVSFWLSFIVTALLIFLGQIYTVKNHLFSLLVLQFRLYILLFPIQLFVFGSVSLLSPFINFIAIPFVGFILLPLLLILTLLMTISFTFELSLELTAVVTLLETILDNLFQLFWSSLERISELTSSSQYNVDNVHLVQLLIYPLVLLLMFKLSIKLKTMIIAILLSSHLQFNKQLFRQDKLDDNVSSALKILVLDVGQGLAVVIQHKHKLLIYDTAYGSRDFNVAEMSLIPWLNSIKATTISSLVISHNDIDHSGGMKTIMNNFQLDKLLIGPDVIVPKDTVNKANSIERCYKGQRLDWPEVSILVLSPPQAMRKLSKGNNSSCVLLLSFKGIKILLSGDIEAEAENILLKNYPALKADIVVVPHHGSQTSSTAAFVSQLQPEIAVISSGYLNRFKFPAQAVLSRYRKVDSEVFNTADTGAVEIVINNQGKYSIKLARSDNLKLWRRH